MKNMIESQLEGAELLRYLRQANYLTLEALGKQIFPNTKGTRTIIHQLEKNKITITVKTAKKLGEFFNVDWKRFIT